MKKILMTMVAALGLALVQMHKFMLVVVSQFRVMTTVVILILLTSSSLK